MSELFLKILNMSISASWVVLAVVLLRVVLKKAPKWINVLLWGMVAVRLVCPISMESVFSLIPSVEAIPEEVISGPSFEVQTGVTVVDKPVNNYLNDRYFEGVTVPANNGFQVMTVFAVIWLVGMAVLFIYTVFSYLCLHRRVNTAVLLKDNIYQSEAVGSPFVLGIVKPGIYLPFTIEATNLEHVIAHEQAHIRRGDHLWKPLGFLLLIIHWFNPLLWLAYVLLCRDIELACDEKVIKELGNEARADYTQALLSCSVNRRQISACPLAFGEVGVKERVKSVMNYKKPAFCVIVLAIVVCIIVAVCFLTNPKENLLHAPEPFCHSYRVEEVLYSDPQVSFSYANNTPRYQFTADYAMFVSGEILSDVDGMEWVQRQGAFKKVKLTSRNFDAYFPFGDGDVSGWQNDNESLAGIRNQTKQAWRIDVTDNENGLFYYLIYTKQKEIYLACGGNVGAATNTEVMTRIGWLFKLTRTDLLSVNAISEDRDAYIEPGYYPEGFDWNYDELGVGTINESGILVFHVDWETDTLVVGEDYYRKNGSSTIIEKETYTIERTPDGKFELEVALRGEQIEEAVYFIQGETGVYVMKIVFGTEEAPLVSASENKVTKWFDYTENPSDMDWNKEITTQIPEFPEIMFRYTPEQIVATRSFDGIDIKGHSILISGMPIWNAYFYDLTGDGIPEICSSLSWGSGMIDNRINICDYANGASYELSDRGNYDYYLRRNEEDDLLYADKKKYMSDELVSTGRLVFQDECIQILSTAVINADDMLTSLEDYYKEKLPSSAADPHVLFADTTSGMIVFGRGEATLIYVTRDGGATWEQAEIPEAGMTWHAMVTCATAISATEYCIGYRYWGNYEGAFYLTKDSGATWTKLEPEMVISKEITDNMRYAEAAGVTYENGKLVVQVSCKTTSGNPWSIEVKLESEDLGETWKVMEVLEKATDAE